MIRQKLRNCSFWLLLLVVICGIPLSVEASISAVTVSQSTNNVTLGRDATVVLTWTVTSNSAGTLSSKQGDFRVNAAGPIISSVITNISGNVPAAGIPVPVTIVETLQIPRSLIQIIQQQNAASFIYQRTFTDSQSTNGTGAATFNITIPTFSADVTTPVSNAAIGTDTVIPLTWTVTSDLTNEPVSSSQGIFIAPAAGTTLGTVNTVLTGTTSALGTALITETVTLPSSVVFQAQKLGETGVIFRRTFQPASVSTLSATADAGVSLTTAAAGGFTIIRIALRFDDNSLVRFITPGSALQPYADIRYNGSGLLQAVWELADPTSTRGEAIYRPLMTVRQFMPASRETTLIGPELPTKLDGFYILRLRITEPQVSAESVVLRYIVGKGNTAGSVTKTPIQLLAPSHLALLLPNTQFKWREIPGTKAYQLEVYTKTSVGQNQGSARAIDESSFPYKGDALAARPITGTIVPGGQTSVSLSMLTRGHLRPGQTYLWRVIAIGDGGVILGESPVRELHVP